MCATGQFGTRLQGGKDAAGARYIMTRLDKIARVVFHEHDDKLLDYLKEEGQSIEPQWCSPNLPLHIKQSPDTYCAVLGMPGCLLKCSQTARYAMVINRLQQTQQLRSRPQPGDVHLTYHCRFDINIVRGWHALHGTSLQLCRSTQRIFSALF